MAGQSPVIVLNKNTKRDHGRRAQLTNIQCAKTIASIVRTTLGPKSMLKMLLDPMGGIVLTNDGNAILREVDVSHPAAKNMLELSRAQDEEVGDGTTSVIVLAGEMLSQAEPLLELMHPTKIIVAWMRAFEEIEKTLKEFGVPLDVGENSEDLHKVVRSTVGTKFASQWSDLMVNMAVKAVRAVYTLTAGGGVEIDIKRYAKVEKVPGGALEDSEVLEGVMFNKDITHPRMRRIINNPRILLLDCPLEYKKGESQTNMELTNENDFAKLLRQEEEEIERMCNAVISVKPDLVITEKGVSDLAGHFLAKARISVIRRIRKTDNNRIARVCGATICGNPHEATEENIGTDCGKFEVKKLGDEYFTFLTECKDPHACSILLRGPSKDVLNEIERNLQDAMAVARNVMMLPQLLPGGGATEMHLSCRLREKAKTVEGSYQYAYRAVADALEVIPRTLAQNCGGDVVRMMTELRSKHASVEDGLCRMGIDGNASRITNMEEANIWDPAAVKLQTLKTAVEAAAMLLRIDDIISGISRKKGMDAPQPKPKGEEQDTFGDSRDG